VVAEHSPEEDVGVATVVLPLGWISLARSATKRVIPQRTVGNPLMKTMNHMKIRSYMQPPMVLILTGTEIPVPHTTSLVSSTT
jgi:hypothetical protein